MVDHVKIVVEEQQAQHRSVLDDRGPVPNLRFSPVLGEVDEPHHLPR